jgi:hypothetical protein
VVTRGPRLKSRREAAGVEVSKVVERGDRSGWVRLRSAVLLVALLAGIGAAAAATIAVVVLVLAAVLDQALG